MSNFSRGSTCSIIQYPVQYKLASFSQFRLGLDLVSSDELSAMCAVTDLHRNLQLYLSSITQQDEFHEQRQP